MLDRAPSGTRISKPSAAMPSAARGRSPRSARSGRPPLRLQLDQGLPHRVQHLDGRRERRVVPLLGRVVGVEVQVHAARRPAGERVQRRAAPEDERDPRDGLQALVRAGHHEVDAVRVDVEPLAEEELIASISTRRPARAATRATSTTGFRRPVVVSWCTTATWLTSGRARSAPPRRPERPASRSRR